MYISHTSLSFISLTFLAGAIAMMFFVVLAGVSDVTPLNKTYFLAADTNGIQGARDRSQWTYLYICSPGNVDCSGAWPAPGFGWAWSGGARGVPDELMGDNGGDTTSKYYFLMWRFGWVFFVIGLFFCVMSFFAGFLACCGRLGSAIAGLASATSLFFYTIAVSLITATFVKARDAFLADDRNATIGTYGFGFIWGAWTAILIATVLFFRGVSGNKGGLSRRNRSVRSRRSVDVGGRRVKDDYA